ncbi:MAG: methionine--tRNA ligase [Candidatus Aenigmarchaeota archaeon]|nr:methionine--tRNA ligase [Candidatus Aenigmarchaeota archaeon]
MKELIGYADFQKLELRVGMIKKAEHVAGTDKLMKLQVDIGEKDDIQLVAGIADSYSAGELIGRNIIVLANLVPKKLKGLESQGMLLAAVVDGKSVLLTIDRNAEPGAVVM